MNRALRAGRGIAGVMLLAACHRAPAALRSATPRGEGTVVTPRDAGMAHTEPLARIEWAGARLRACGGRRIERAAEAPRTVPGPCVHAAAPGTALDGGVAAFADASADPPAPCRLLYEDILGNPGAPPARASLVGPLGRQLIDAWAVPDEVDGDYFAVEVAFSPDRRWIAVVHSAIGLGDGERLVRVIDAAVRPAPACR